MIRSPFCNFVFGIVAGAVLASMFWQFQLVHVTADMHAAVESWKQTAANYARTAELAQQRAELCEAESRTHAAKLVASSDPLTLLNIVRPGLGDLAAKLNSANRAAKTVEAGECPAGSEPQTGPWQGYKCVAVGPVQ